MNAAAKKKLKVTTYKKVISLFMVIIAGFAILFFILQHYNIKHQKAYYKTSSESLRREINSLMKLKSEGYISLVTEITYWDELVEFTKTNNTRWLNNSLSYLIDSYKIDYLDVYTIDEQFLNKLSSSKMRSKNFIPKEVFSLLNKDKLITFYVKVKEGVLLLHGATIHASEDPFKNKTAPQGYLFLGKLLDEKYFSNIQKISGSHVYNARANKAKMNAYEISTIKPIKDINGEKIGAFLFAKRARIDFGINKITLYALVIGFLVSILVMFYYAREWIRKPIRLIQDILENGNLGAIDNLKAVGGEYINIGTLFEENHNHKIQLEKTTAKAEESDKLKSAFLMNLSHEIKTPMNAILGFSKLTLESQTSQQEREDYVKVIQKSGKSLVSIIDDLVEVSKIDSNVVKPKYSSVNLNTILTATFESIKMTIVKEKDIDFKFIPSKKVLTKKIITDAIKLNQIITHLLVNAVKFTDEGFVILEYNVDLDDKKINITVRDSGKGIPSEYHEKIFVRFNKIDTETDDVDEYGLGLGLPIAKAYVELLGGAISLKSQVGVGSTFSFFIPLQMDESIDGSNMHPNKTDDPIDLGNEEIILVAEDDNLNYLLIEKLLQLFNFKILRAKNGEEAVNICKENDEVDLVLMDIKMPYLDGHGAFIKIREFNTKIPIIAHTAYSFPEELEKIKQTGFDGFLPKPIDKTLLLTIVKKHMGK